MVVAASRITESADIIVVVKKLFQYEKFCFKWWNFVDAFLFQTSAEMLFWFQSQSSNYDYIYILIILNININIIATPSVSETSDRPVLINYANVEYISCIWHLHGLILVRSVCRTPACHRTLECEQAWVELRLPGLLFKRFKGMIIKSFDTG